MTKTTWKSSLKSLAFGPVGVTVLAMLLIVAITLFNSGGDPLAFVEMGTQFSEGDPNGTQGYDGQFVYYIARELNPARVRPFLDVPAYRYQRILLPMLARVLSVGRTAVLPWMLLGVVSFAHGAGTWLVSRMLEEWRVSRWYALVYGLWVGLLLGVRLDLPEPLAYGLVAAAVWAASRKRHGLSWLLYALAIFAKEVTIIFAVAQGVVDLWQRKWGRALGLLFVAGVPFLIFQGWLWFTFGAPGIGSGGAMATSFEFVPFMGLLRVGAYSWVFMLAVLAVLGPSIVFPALWALKASLQRWRRGGQEYLVAALFFNALVIPFTPFSTFREPAAMFRFASGLILAILLYAARYRKRRVLNYSLLWVVLNVILFN